MGRLYWKFFFFFLLAQLTSVFGISVALWIHNRSQENAVIGLEEGPPARTVVAAAAATLRHGGTEALQHMLEEWPRRRMPQVYAVDEGGRELMQREIPDEIVELAQEQASKEDDKAVRQVLADDGHQYLLFVPAKRRIAKGEPPPIIDGRPMDGRSAMEENPPPRRAGRLFPIAPLSAGLIASLIFAALLAWYFSKPIRSLRRAFETAAEGKLDVRVSDAMGHRRDELSDLGRDFDSMATRLESLIQGQNRLLHHVSHELRSPLARMQMAIGLARQNAEKIPGVLDRIERESSRMDKLVGELLAFSRLESGLTSLKKESVDVNELLTGLAEDARFESQPNGIDIRYHVTGPLFINGQPELLHRAIENILRNAVKFSSSGDVIMIEASRQTASNQIVIAIKDNGPGVPQDELQEIFQPFYRGSTAHNKEGYGIGLAIAKQVLDLHGGSITASNREDGGLVVTVILPANQ